MEEADFFEASTDRLQTLLKNPRFVNERNQLRSRVLLGSLATEGFSGASPRFTFDEQRLWRNCLVILAAVARPGALSSRRASDLRDVARVAAEVAEHLALRAESIDRARAAIASSFLYHISGYEANGICLARRLNTIPAVNIDIDRDFLDGVASFLQRTFGWLRQETVRREAVVQEQIESLSNSDAPDPEEFINQAAMLHLHRGLRGIANYGLFGDLQFRTTWVDELANGVECLASLGLVDLATIADALRAAAAIFYERSTWTVLRELGKTEDPVWRDYLRMLAIGDSRDIRSRSVVELWPSQRAALDAGLLTGAMGFAVQMPTGAGKTRIAELAILDALTRNPERRCVYVAPFRALAYEVEQSLSRTIGQVGFRVSSVLGSFETDDFENYLLTETDVLIATPEKLDLLFRTNPSYFDNVSLLILDEGHIVDSSDRGARYELLLTKIKRRTKGHGTRFLFISAVMAEANTRQFAEWLADSQDRLLSTDWRPSRQLLGIFQWDGGHGRITYMSDGAGGGQAPFVPRVIERRSAPLGRAGSQHAHEFPTISNKGQTAAALAIRFAEAGQVLVFCSQTNFVKSTAQAMLTGLEFYEASAVPVPESLRARQSGEAVVIAREWLGEDHIVVTALQRGVGIHFGLLPEAVRQAVEDDFRAGRIRILISTNTLAQGVNLPIATAIVHSMVRFRTEMGQRDRDDVSVRDFWNICGRAGRAGIDTQGQIIYLVQTATDRALYRRYFDRAQIEPVQSRLLKALRDLVHQRLTVEALGTELDSDILSILLEEAVETPTESDIEAVLGDSLVKVQARDANEELTPLVVGLTEVAHSAYGRTGDAAKRRLFASTGLSIRTCERLFTAVQDNHDRIKASLVSSALGTDSPLPLAAVAYDSCWDLDEIKPRQQRVKTPILLTSWITGQPISQLWETYRDESNGQGGREGLSQYIEDVFVFKLPWGFNAFCRFAAFALGLDLQQNLQLRYLPSITRFGVPDHVACWARSMGIPGRAMALELARAFRADQVVAPDFLNFMRWLATLTVDDLRERFHLSGFQLEQVAGKIRNLWTPESHRPVDANLFTFQVRGIRYNRRLDGVMRMPLGSQVRLDREPNNPYDPNAIRVYWESVDIGFVARDIAKYLARELDSGRPFIASVVELESRTGGFEPFHVVVRAVAE